jgi:endonuclease YncB( thermonuclease family)
MLTAIIAVSCNPVKQVLKSKAKFDEVKNEVFRLGLCANDTTFITNSDTLIQYDTTVLKETEIITIDDTVYVTKWLTRDIVKKLTIRDTVNIVVVDNSRLTLLQADIRASESKAKEYKENANEYKQRANKRLRYLIYAVIAFGIWVFIKLRL